MKVLVFFTYNTSILDWEESGHIERESNFYKKFSKKHNVDFIFFTYGNSTDLRTAKKYFDFKVIPIYKYKKKYNNKYLNFMNSLTFPFFIRKINNDFDIMRTNQLNGAWIPILYKILYKKPLIIRTGYDALSFKRHEKKKLFVKGFYYFLTKIALSISDKYYSTSKTDIEKIKSEFSVEENKITYVPNWVENRTTNPNKSISVDTFISVGRLEKQKNFEYLIKSFENSEYSLNIVGTGSQEKSLKTISESHNVSVNFIGRLSNSDLLTLLKTYKIFISSSLYEGNPKSVLEAMNSGCMIIANKTPNLNEFLTHNENCIFFDHSKDNLIEVINLAVKNPSLVQKIANEGFKTVQKNNSLDKIINIEFSDYKDLVS